MQQMENGRMQIDKKQEGEKLTLMVTGRLDTNTSPDLEAALNLDGVTDVVFDRSGLEYISSAGLRILLAVQKTMMASGGRMTVASPNATVKGVFDITGMSDIFTIVR